MRTRLTAGAAGAVVASVLLAATSPALADGTADAWNDGSSVGGAAEEEIQVPSEPASTGASSRKRGGAASDCSYSVLTGDDAAAAEGFAESGWSRAKQGEGPGKWFRKVCTDEQGQSKGTVVWVADREPVDPLVLARRAQDRVAVPEPAVHLNPAADRNQVVNLPTLLWIDASQWQPVTASASAGGVTATVAARPVGVEWDMGNGDTLTCPGPGTPYQDGTPTTEAACQYTYRRSSASVPGGAFTVTATTVWEVAWDADGAAGGGSLGTSRRSTSFPVRVAEIQAVNQ